MNNISTFRQLYYTCKEQNKPIYEIALDYESKFPENVLLLSCKSFSIEDGRNLGIGYCTGNYINFLDCRDYLDKNALEEIILSVQLGAYAS